MYLYMLQDHVHNMPTHEWEMHPANEAATEFLKRAERRLEKHWYPLPTTTAGPPDECQFKFTRHVGIGPDHEYIVRVLDMSGEWFEDMEKGKISSDETNVVKSYLYNCQGLLCLVDPDKDENESRMRYLRELLLELRFREGGPIRKWFAFCLTKMDAPQHRPHLLDPKGYIQQKLGNRMIRVIGDHCIPGRFRFDFACSAVGYYHKPNGQLFQPERSNSGIDWFGQSIIYNVEHIEPFSLFEPLQWLFENGVGRV